MQYGVRWLVGMKTWAFGNWWEFSLLVYWQCSNLMRGSVFWDVHLHGCISSFRRSETLSTNYAATPCLYRCENLKIRYLIKLTLWCKMQMFIWCCCTDGVPDLPFLENSLFWAITQPVVVIPYRRFGTTYGSRFLTLEDCTDKLSRNVDKNLPILSA
jgi:hypothetical protein